MSSGRRDLVATLTSAIIGAVALVACGLVVVLTDDDLGAATGALGGDPSSSGGGSALPGGDSSGSGSNPGSDSGSSTGGGLTTPAPEKCTKTECPALGPPTKPPDVFPFPPGARPVVYTDDFCADFKTPGTTVREVAGSLDEIRDYYLANLLDAGYGWGLGTLTANPRTTTASGREVPYGWDGTLTTSDGGYAGNLALEGKVGPRSACGPDTGFVYITMETA